MNRFSQKKEKERKKSLELKAGGEKGKKK